MHMKRYIGFFVAGALLTLLSVVGAKTPLATTPMKMPASTKIAQAAKIIENCYVDTIDTDNMADEAIRAMLKTLDPHSSYSDPEETKELNASLNGNFSGIGVQFNMVNDTLYVIQTTAGGPSEGVGILPGDRILQADDSIISGAKRSNAQIIQILRGPKGSKVLLKIARKGVDEPIEFLVTRDDIPVYSIDAAYIADEKNGIGYIKLARFGETTPAEINEAMKKLTKLGMKHLIIDLEDNTGGYLGSATDLAGRFLNKGDMIVYTLSPSMGDHYYRAEDQQQFSGRVVVLVNQYSASASEITAGAIQDNDRGVIVGRRSFGKGLVQRPFPFPDGSMIRLTVAKYYTPSGRCIQKPYEMGNESEYRSDMLHRYESGEFSSADSIHFSDSEKFETIRSHRTVYGGGGIMPDVFVPVDTVGLTKYLRNLNAKSIINRYALQYVDTNRKELEKQYPKEDDFVKNFVVSDAMINDMVALGEKEGVEKDEAQFEESKETFRTIIKGLIGRDLFDMQTYYKIYNPALNPIYQQGLEIINDSKRYSKLLK